MRVLTLTILLLTCLSVCKAEDVLLTRGGIEYKGKLEVASDKEITFSVKSGSLFKSQNTLQTFPTDDVYMIKTDKRGTIFYNRNRERLMLPTQAVPKNADVIYLADGGEIPAWQLSLENGIITFQKDPKQKRAMSNIGAYPVENVFMVKYNDGSRDIFTDISAQPTPTAASGKTEKIKVVMYTAVKGDTLGSIAEKYNVEVPDIIEWNEMSAKTTAKTPLTPGQQILIQLTVYE